MKFLVNLIFVFIILFPLASNAQFMDSRARTANSNPISTTQVEANQSSLDMNQFLSLLEAGRIEEAQLMATSKEIPGAQAIIEEYLAIDPTKEQ